MEVSYWYNGNFFWGGEGVKSNLNKTLCFIYANMKAFVAYIGTGEKQLKASMKAANPCQLPLHRKCTYAIPSRSCSKEALQTSATANTFPSLNSLLGLYYPSP